MTSRCIPWVALAVAAVVAPAAASAGPVIEAGREAEVEALFEGIGSGATAGWRTGDIAVSPRTIRANLHGPGEARLVIDLRQRVGDGGAVAHTPSFDLFLVEAVGADAAAARAAAVAVAARDDGRFWEAAAWETEAGWLTTAGGLANLAWLAGLAALMGVVLASVLRRRVLAARSVRRALFDIVLMVSAALAVRLLLFDAGPGNLRSHLPDPGVLPREIATFGPGYDAWMRLWFALVGSDDSTAFLAGAFAGALTVIPVYLLGWCALGRRSVGLASAVVLAVFPIHARLCPTDDPAVLVGLLLVSATALAVVADRRGEGSLLVGAWLAAGLAAATRPEAALALPPLAALIGSLPVARWLQLRPVVAVLSTLAAAGGVASAAAAALPVLDVALGFLFPRLADVGRLLGPGLVLAPPRTSLMLGIPILIGLVVATRVTRGRALLWVAVALLPVLPGLGLLLPDLITARYQAPLLPVGAVLAGTAVSWVGRHLRARRPGLAPFLPAAGAIAAAAVLGAAALWPPPEPTFRLEYAFFRRHLGAVPADCRIVQTRWEGDHGLEPPRHLSALRAPHHEWIEPSPTLDLSAGCFVWWRPAACDVLPEPFPGDRRPPHEDCRLLEDHYRLAPLAVTRLPARPGFIERHAGPEVTVGFFRLENF